MVIWLTGLSASGKTTLCKSMYKILKIKDPTFVMIDGDIIRKILSTDLNYKENSRYIQIQRIQFLSKVLYDQNISVIVAALYAHPNLLLWNRDNFEKYVEIYIRADVEFLISRETKGLYAGARRGELTDVVGIDIPWHEPQTPDLVIDAKSAPPPDKLARQVIASVPTLAAFGSEPVAEVSA